MLAGRIGGGSVSFVGAVALLWATGCHGPLGTPMVTRLDPNDQRAVDAAWDAMLDPPDRLDRELLFDALLVQQLHHYGVDRLYLQSEKATAAGRVVMEVAYDRLDPNADAFTLSVLDDTGLVLRQEVYSFEEIERRMECLAREVASTDPDDPNAPPPCPELHPDGSPRGARLEAIRTAIQPGQ